MRMQQKGKGNRDREGEKRPRWAKLSSLVVYMMLCVKWEGDRDRSRVWTTVSKFEGIVIREAGLMHPKSTSRRYLRLPASVVLGS